MWILLIYIYRGTFFRRKAPKKYSKRIFYIPVPHEEMEFPERNPVHLAKILAGMVDEGTIPPGLSNFTAEIWFQRNFEVQEQELNSGSATKNIILYLYAANPQGSIIFFSCRHNSST